MFDGLSSLQDFVQALIESVPAAAGIHPSGAQIIHEYLSEARDAACAEDAAEVARLAGLVQRKVRQETTWYREDLAAAARGWRPDERGATWTGVGWRWPDGSMTWS